MNDRTERCFTEARNYAQETANRLHCAASWVAFPPDPIDDDRDPAAMTKQNMDAALASAMAALYRVRELRKLLSVA